MKGRPERVLLLAFGAVTVVVAAGHDLTVYVRPGVRWLILAAGVIMLGVAAVGLHSGAAHEHAGPDPDPRPVLAWALLAPVLVLAVVAPPPLGALTAERPPAAPPRHDGGFPALPARGVLAESVSDVVLRTVWEHGRSLDGRTLRVVGFVVRAQRGGFVLARLVVTCCAADARPYDVDVRWPGPAPPRGTWVAVTGRYQGPLPGNHLVPVLAGRQVRTVTVPAHPYE